MKGGLQRGTSIQTWERHIPLPGLVQPPCLSMLLWGASRTAEEVSGYSLCCGPDLGLECNGVERG